MLAAGMVDFQQATHKVNKERKRVKRYPSHAVACVGDVGLCHRQLLSPRSGSNPVADAHHQRQHGRGGDGDGRHARGGGDPEAVAGRLRLSGRNHGINRRGAGLLARGRARLDRGIAGDGLGVGVGNADATTRDEVGSADGAGRADVARVAAAHARLAHAGVGAHSALGAHEHAGHPGGARLVCRLNLLHLRLVVLPATVVVAIVDFADAVATDTHSVQVPGGLECLLVRQLNLAVDTAHHAVQGVNGGRGAAISRQHRHLHRIRQLTILVAAHHDVVIEQHRVQRDAEEVVGDVGADLIQGSGVGCRADDFAPRLVVERHAHCERRGACRGVAAAHAALVHLRSCAALV
mmetsp:Transcript_6927/g.18104  ORF Transcript_6927/g.18104 Transcript_6927/m.18104 type:complete len:350 (-) Transcript_6927:22-1071(-)